MTDNKTDIISSIELLRADVKAAKKITAESTQAFDNARHLMNQTALEGNLECSKIKSEYMDKIQALQQEISNIQASYARELKKCRKQF